MVVDDAASGVRLYGRASSPASDRARRILEQHGVPHAFLDVDADSHAREFVRQLSRGQVTVPMVVLANGDVLIAPTDEELAASLEARA